MTHLENGNRASVRERQYTTKRRVGQEGCAVRSEFSAPP
jgi:hypothetical protein